MHICITDPDSCHLFIGYECIQKNHKAVVQNDPDRRSGKTCTMIALVIIKRMVELAFFWPSSS